MTLTLKINKSAQLGIVSSKEWKALKNSLKKRDFTLKKPYQEEGVRWMIQRERSDRPYGLLCDEPGLGKTIQTIATMMVNKKRRTLIAVPTCVLTQWKDTLETLIPQQTYVFHGSFRPRHATQLRHLLKTKTVVLTTIGLLFSRADQVGKTVIQKLKWDRFVVDECHFLKNPKTRCFQGAGLIRAPIRWGLTGTPIQNKVADIATLFNFIGATSNNIKTLQKFHLLRRTKSQLAEIDDSLKLPPITIDIKNIELTKAEAKAHQQVDELSTYPIERIIRKTQTEIHPDITLKSDSWRDRFQDKVQYSPIGSSKITTLVNDISSHPQDQSLVFCQFVKEIDFIQQALQNASISTAHIRGNTTHAQRNDIINKCKNNTINTLIIQINAGSVGLNLQFANRVYILSPTFNPTIELQAIARAHRIGQTKHVFVTKYISNIHPKQTTDQYKLQIQKHKMILIQNILQDHSPLNITS